MDLPLACIFSRSAYSGSIALSLAVYSGVFDCTAVYFDHDNHCSNRAGACWAHESRATACVLLIFPVVTKQKRGRKKHKRTRIRGRVSVFVKLPCHKHLLPAMLRIFCTYHMFQILIKNYQARDLWSDLVAWVWYRKLCDQRRYVRTNGCIYWVYGLAFRSRRPDPRIDTISTCQKWTRYTYSRVYKPFLLPMVQVPVGSCDCLCWCDKFNM